jgi:hypothetical protein
VLDLTLLVLGEEEEIEEDEPVVVELLDETFADELAMEGEATMGLFEDNELEDMLEMIDEIGVFEITEEIDVLTLLILSVILLSRHSDIRTCSEQQSQLRRRCLEM